MIEGKDFLQSPEKKTPLQQYSDFINLYRQLPVWVGKEVMDVRMAWVDEVSKFTDELIRTGVVVPEAYPKKPEEIARLDQIAEERMEQRRTSEHKVFYMAKVEKMVDALPETEAFGEIVTERFDKFYDGGIEIDDLPEGEPIDIDIEYARLDDQIIFLDPEKNGGMFNPENAGELDEELYAIEATSLTALNLHGQEIAEFIDWAMGGHTDPILLKTKHEEDLYSADTTKRRERLVRWRQQHIEKFGKEPKAVRKEQ